MSIHVYGIRHHGPGCARSLITALVDLEPDIVLVEGPPDAQEIVPLLMRPEMQPPVALLVYDPAAPHDAAFYPFTHYSPEWQALRYACGRGVPARLMDLPRVDTGERPPASGEQPSGVSHEPASNGAPAGQDRENGRAVGDGHNVPAPAAEDSVTVATVTVDEPDVAHQDRQDKASLRDDPIGMLAEAAGYRDHELWWEHQIEQRQDPAGLFDGILEAMTALRSARIPAQGGQEAQMEAWREAAMRQAIRAAQKEGFTRIAVVCGAWHAPVLADPGPAAGDAALLAPLKRKKTAATWIPWTNARLSYRSGYGAGVRSPGWYEHLWTAPDRHAIRWMARIAHLLREQDLDASSASVIEAVRLGEALAALRGLPMPGLSELHEAAQTILCKGETTPMLLIRERLEVGERLGEVPPETPAVPLQQDLALQQRRLRLKPSGEQKDLDLDLRNQTDRARSQLLHQMRLLGLAWGEPQEARGKSGTFHELWRLQWQPEFAVALIEANVWGNTVEGAAAAKACHESDTATDLPRLTHLLDATILAALPDAITSVLARVKEQAAVTADVRHLMEALPPLARVARYGDVRGTASERVRPVIDALFERIVVGLPGACASLDDDAAGEMVGGMGGVHDSVDLLDLRDERDEWDGMLRRLVENDGVHGLVRGWSCRLLLEHGVLDPSALQRLARLALSPVTPAAQAAAWLEGVLRGSALLLLQQDGLWAALDAWIGELTAGPFTETLPLLRRAFSHFDLPERRAMGEKVKRLGLTGGSHDRAGQDVTDAGAGIDRARADLVLPVLARILGHKTNT